MATPKISDEDLKAAYFANDKNYAKTGRAVGLDRGALQKRLERILGDDSRAAKMERLRALDDMLEAREIDPREVIIKGAKITKGTWDVTAKVKEIDADGNKVQRLVTTANKRAGTEIVFSPKFAEGPKWPVIQPGPTIIVKHAKRKPLQREPGMKCAVLISDEQIGYWRDLHTDELSAFHDERAMDIALQIIEDVRPDVIVDDGDLIDNPEYSAKFRKFPEFAGMSQRAINRGTLWCAQLRESAGEECEITEVEGNHDARIANFIIDNAAAAHGLTKGYDQRTPTFRDQPVLSLANLLCLEQQNIKYSAAFPGGDVWLNDGLVVCHEDAKIREEERATTFHGHDHRVHQQWITVWHRGKQLRRGVIGIGALCRTEEIVDSFQRRMRSVIPAGKVRQNWQQGLVIVHYPENGGPSDCSIQPVQIVDGKAWVGSRLYSARPRDINGHLIA